MSTEELILNKYGCPLLNFGQVADLLDRSPGGLRITLCRAGELSDRLRDCRIKVDRRVLFRVADLARMPDEL